MGNKLKKVRQKKQAESLSMVWGGGNQAESEVSCLGLHPRTGWMHILVLILGLPGMQTPALDADLRGWG